MRNKIVLFCLVFLLFAGCREKNIYFEYHNLESAVWNKDSLQRFEVEINDSLGLYNLYLCVRNTANYPYQNCWLFISENEPSAEQKKDTIEFFLADQRGRWLGSGVGASKEMPVLFQVNRRFEQKGIYSFEIRHGMRDDELIGISDVGLRIEKVDNGKK